MYNNIAERISHIRTWLKTQQLDAFIVPHEDEFLGEYLPEHNERLHWLTGFTGSAGLAIITLDHAAIFVDGRYTVQVTKQVPDALFQYHDFTEAKYLDWLQSHLSVEKKIGFDPRMHRSAWLASAQTTLSKKQLTLVPVAQNPIDLFWSDRPEATLSAMWLMPESVAGESSQHKREKVASILQDNQVDCAILTQTDAICWLLNIRGNDIPCLPVLLSHAIIDQQGCVDFFIDQTRVIPEFSAHVGSGVQICPPESLPEALSALKGKRVQIDTQACNAWLSLTLQGLGVDYIHAADPCALLKAVKNPSEIAGMKACHIRDGVAMVHFLTWLDQQVADNQPHTEATLSDKLAMYRQMDPTFIDFSFDTISASGPNAAMCHYNHLNQPEPSILVKDTFYLVDSGGHYRDGTTDITRTIAIGHLSDELKRQFTLVLKGHIALATARFPLGTSGSQLDTLARQYLWAYGYDFDHGTGHGVGHCLNVHEGPQRIATVPNIVALQPGMVLSNEPGYYRADEYGIRIENLELVVEVATQGEKPTLGFESLTRCPIDVRGIELSLLTEQELAWLNHYHATVLQELSPLISDTATLAWLQQATKPLAH